MKSIFIFGNNDILINYYKYFTALNYKVIISCDIKKANKCDILCLAGGGDVNPYFYGQRNISSTNLDTFRDLAELELTYLFISKNKPIIAICRGLQLLNVYFGGSILQNINNHSQVNGQDYYHKIITLKNGLLSEYKSKIIVNSAHHQAVDILGKNLIVDSISLDGVIESFYHKYLPIYAFQFHPERLKDKLLLNFIIKKIT